MKNVRLHGKLGKRFVPSIDLDVSTPLEAMSALMANFPEMKGYLAKKELEGIKYGIKNRDTGKFLEEREIEMQTSAGFDICPAPSGGLAAMAMGLVTSLISGYFTKAVAEGMKQDNEILTAETNSFIFKGKQNRQEQGTTVPLGYGRMLVGSNVVSSAINNYDLDSEKGSIYTLEVGAYTLLPYYHKHYDADLGPLQSSALASVAEGNSAMSISSPEYRELKEKMAGTRFGSNDGLYGSSVTTDGHEYSKKILGGVGGNLDYKIIYNQGVEEAFLTNFKGNGNFEPNLYLAQYPDQDLRRLTPEQKWELAVLRFTNRVKHDERLKEMVQEAYNLPGWNNINDTKPLDYVDEADLRRSGFAILQSSPQLETISDDKKFYPIGYKNGDIINVEDNKFDVRQDALTVGSRYLKNNKENGLGWHKFESVSISKCVDLVCEGPIGGFCDPDGNHLEFKDSSTSSKNPREDDYLRAVFLNDFPVKEVKEISPTESQSVYNVNEFDIDVGRKGNEIGSNDQELLEEKYRFISETKQVGARLFGPHTLNAEDAVAAAGAGMVTWNKNTPFHERGAYVEHTGEDDKLVKFICQRSTNNVFNKLENYIRNPSEPPHIVVVNPEYVKGSEGVLKGGDLYVSNNIFVQNELDPTKIGEFMDNAVYRPGDIVFERSEYNGDDPYGNDDKAQEEASGEPTLLNYEDPDQMYTQCAYWEAGPSSGKVKRWKAGNAYEQGDIIYDGTRAKAFKAINAIEEWDTSLIGLGQAGARKKTTDGSGEKLPFVVLEDPEKFEQASAEDAGGFIAAMVQLDPGTFSEIDITPSDSSLYWTRIQAGEYPDNFKTAIGGEKLYHDPRGFKDGELSDEKTTDYLSPVFKSALDTSGEISFDPAEEYPISHIITNQLVSEALVSIQLEQLSYLYPGDKVEVTYRPGALMFAVLGAIISVGATADTLAEADEFDVMAYVAAAFWGGLIGYVIGIAVERHAQFKIGTKIDNSGETWPNKVKFRIKYGNEGSPLYETDVSFFGVCTSAYIKDIKIYFPENPLGRTRIIKVCKISRERNPVKEGEQAMRYREQASFASVTEISKVTCSYPNSVVIGTRVNAKDMPSMPKRNYHLLLKKVKVPNNYDPVQKTYGEMWNGEFDSELKWTDNPAWCLYDLISNNSYGLGRFGMDENYIDKWTFYRAAKYCDEVIPTGYSPAYKKRKFKYKTGLSIRIDRDEYDSKQEFQREFGYPGKKIAIFYKKINGDQAYLIRTIQSITAVVSGEQEVYDVNIDKELPEQLTESQEPRCCAEIYYPVLENRYRFNALLTSPQNAFKMINEIANAFRAFTYWGGGKVNFYLDEPKEPLLLFGNNNISEEGFVYSSTPRHSRTNAVKIKYLDEHNAFKPKVEYIEDREKIIDNGLHELSLNSLGTSTKTQAHRIAEYTLQAANLETELVSFTTSMPGSYLRPGDIIDVIDNKKTIGRFAGKVLNYDVSGDGKVGYLDIDFPVRTIVDEDDSDTFKTIKLYNISGYQTLEDLNEKSKNGSAISDEEIKGIRAGHIDDFQVGSITNNDTRIEIINNPYSFVSGSYNWAEAVRDARLRGGEVATINNDVDQRFVQTVLPRDRKAKAWIGGYYKEQPPPEEFVWLDPQACDYNKIDFFSWAEGFPALADPIAIENEDIITNDPPDVVNNEDVFQIAADSLDLENAHNFVSVSGSDDKTIHGDWITQDGLVRQGYILEKRADDKLLRLNGIEGLTYLLEDEVNMATPTQYKVMNIKQQENHTYLIEGSQYSSGKFGTIENNEMLPIPKSPIIHTKKTIDPPGNVAISMLDEDIDEGLPYGIKVSWVHPSESTIRAYKVQIFDGAQLKKTTEVKKSGELYQFIEFRDKSINEGGVYTARVEAMQ